MLIEAGCEGKTVAQCQLPHPEPAGTLSRSAFAAKSSYIDAAAPGRRGRRRWSTRWSRWAPICPASAAASSSTATAASINQVAAGRHGLRAPRCHRLRAVLRHLRRRRARPRRSCGRPSWLDQTQSTLRPVCAGLVPELHRPDAARLGRGVLRGQPAPTHAGQGGVRPRRCLPLRPVDPAPK